jgi:hypothetical protein
LLARCQKTVCMRSRLFSVNLGHAFDAIIQRA